MSEDNCCSQCVSSMEAEKKVDYYSVLGCDQQSSEEQILTEFRVRAKQTHPDKDTGDTEEFQVASINQIPEFSSFCRL